MHQLVRVGSTTEFGQDSIMSNSQQYEVMYVGRIRVSLSLFVYTAQFISNHTLHLNGLSQSFNDN